MGFFLLGLSDADPEGLRVSGQTLWYPAMLMLVPIQKERRRRIRRAFVDFISLVPRGANRMPVIFKSDDTDPTKGSLDLDMLVRVGKKFDEDGELLAVVYAPEHRDYQGDIASAEVIRDAAHTFMKKGGAIDIRHDGTKVPVEKAFLAESFIVQKGDERFAQFQDYDGKIVDVAGAWASVIKIDDPALRAEYRSGKWTGVSIGGRALVESEKSDDALPEQVAAALLKALGLELPKNQKKDPSMTPEQMAALQKSFSDALTTGLAALAVDLKKAFAPAEPPKVEAKKSAVTTAPIFKGDATNDAHVAAHLKALAFHNLRKDVDWTDAESVATYQTELAMFKEQFGECPSTSRSGALPPSNAAAAGDTEQESGSLQFSGLTKEQVTQATHGSRLADQINKSRGFKVG